MDEMDEFRKWEQKLDHLAEDQLANGENLSEVQSKAQEDLIEVQRKAQGLLGRVQREALLTFWSEVKLVALSPVARKVNTILTTYLNAGPGKGIAGVHGKTEKALELNNELFQNLVTNTSKMVDVKQCIESNDLNKERWELWLGEVRFYLKELHDGLRGLYPDMGQQQERVQVVAVYEEIGQAIRFVSALEEACVAQYLLIWKRTNGTRTLAFLGAESVRLSAAKTRNVQSTNANRFKI
jgi:hypothetical protein